MKLTDDDPFGSVDDEGSPVRHQRDIAQRDGFMKYGVFHLEVEINAEGSGIGNSVLDAVDDIFLGRRNRI